MGSKWPLVTVDDIATVKSGKRLPKDNELVEFVTAHPYIRLVDVSEGKVRTENLKYLQPETQKKISRYIVNTGDVCLAIVGHTIGMVFYIGEEWDSVNLTENAARITEVSSEFNSQFIYYYLNSSVGQNDLLSRKVGSAQGKLPLYNIKSLEIPAPPKKYQDQVVKILGTLDKKIELNRQTNQTLEQMAQTLFKSWFVDFDPVFDNLLAKANYQLENLPADFPEELYPKAVTRLAALNACISLQEHESERLASRHENDNAPLPHPDFPSEFEFNEQLGWVPLGWENKTIKDFGKVVTGKTPPKNVQDAYHSQGSPFITPTDIDESVFIIETNRRLSESGQFSVKNNKIIKNSICVTCIGSQMGKTVIAPFDSYTNQQINSVILHSSFTKSYLFTNLRNRREEIFAQGSSGSTMPILNKSSFEKLSVLSPNDESLKKFDVVVSSYLDGILQRSIQNKELTKLRDTLLPKLISGELQIPDLEPRSHALRGNA